MSVVIKGPLGAPCTICPYRRDTPPGVWSEDEYKKLPGFDGPTGTQTPGYFLCHKDNGHLCAGWVGCHDMKENLGLRIALSFGDISVEDWRLTHVYESPVELWESGQAAMEHGISGIEDPSPEAAAAVRKLVERRGTVDGKPFTLRTNPSYDD